MKQEYKQAFSEVNDIIKIMPEELASKIPKSFKQMVADERDKEYKTNIQEPLEKVKLKNGTIIILGLIYRDFLCSKEERKKLQEKDAKEIQEMKLQLEKEMREKYNPDKIFDRTEKVNQESTMNNISKETALVEIKEEGFIAKLKMIIKKLFKF